MRKLLSLVVLVVSAVPLLAEAATPSEGVPLVVRRGFFTETDIGGLVNFGGLDGYSNLQTYLQLGVGYSLPVNARSVGDTVELGFHVGIGASAGNCYGQRRLTDATRTCVGSAVSKILPDNFTVFFVDVSAAYLFGILERLYIGPKLVGGFTILDPPPVEGGDGSLVRYGANAGLGVSLEYATNMDHFSVGVDVVFRFIIGPNIPSLQFFPRVKYTF